MTIHKPSIEIYEKSMKNQAFDTKKLAHQK